MGIKSEKIVKYRYPGTKFFEADQNNIFFGRKEETQNLTHSIRAHDIFVIYADSGIGKTSLLNAGLLPALEKDRDTEQIVPIKVRFQDSKSSPLEILRKKLSEFMESDGTLAPGEENILWKYFKSLRFRNNSGSMEKIPLLIFDQFEEFFVYKKEDRENIIDGLADLTNQYLPDLIREEMKTKFSDRLPTSEELKYYSAPHLKILFLIRADKLKLLDSLSKKIPLILRNRFHLKPLNVKQAEQAILYPACLPQNDFASPPFSYQPEAVNQICNYLKNEEDEVESFQLQVLCQELEKMIIRRYSDGNSHGDLEITIEDLGGEAGMNNITKNYYVNKINEISDLAMRKKAIELIEEELIVEGRRVSQADFYLLKKGYNRELLDHLLNTTRLIRIDNDGYIEISHDRLLPSILALKQKRNDEEFRESAMRKLKEEEEQRKQQELKKIQEEKRQLEMDYLKVKVRKSARLRILSILLVILLIGVIGSGIYADRAKIDANLALANFHISNQDYNHAETIIHNKGFFGIFNFGYKQKRKDTLDRIIHFFRNYSNMIYDVKKQADSVTQIASELAERAGSQLDSIALIVEKDRVSNEMAKEFKSMDLAELFDGEKIMLAAKLNDSIIKLAFPMDAIAQSDSLYKKRDSLRNSMLGFTFELPEDTLDVLKLNRQKVENSLRQLFKVSLDATSFLFEHNYRKSSVETLNMARELKLIAFKNSMALDPEDTIYYNGLHKILGNEKQVH